MNRFTVADIRLALTVAVLSLALPLLASSLRAEDMSGQDMAGQDMDAMPDAAENPNLECATEPLSGSGPGFSSSRDASEEAARAAWLEKAKAVYPEATWETAKDADVACAVQGLYSKCFAQGIPCRPKAADADDADAAAAAPESDTPKPE
ncbi:hypothetical protein AUC69_08580 [Methyloceanibacter superfactus]|uniref:Uncharacterized protein n=1 Tax=Methyloceanibacter superfactus TaxID=1774969 RepID=A0A1E3W1H7_9HYPH|nr:hypothetical protein [Methyloceanibacter superfactus]ODR99665.1 hypothetical protein AUC69_08580 [Methyloceanibacter superfactus]